MNTLSINSCFVLESYIISIVVSSINININGIFLLKVLMLRICISLFTDQHSVPPTMSSLLSWNVNEEGAAWSFVPHRSALPPFPCDYTSKKQEKQKEMI